MNKSNFLINTILDKSNVAIFCILGMMIGFLCSPAVSSISVFLFGFNAIRDVHPRKWIAQKWWLLGLIWVICYAVTWFWSEDKGYWGVRLQVKLPFLLLPLAFGFLPKFTPKQIQFITVSIAPILLSGVYYSISFLIDDFNYYLAEYKYSHLIPTPVRGDHIRFSLSIALYIVWSFYAFQHLQTKAVKWFVGLCIGLLFIYLHVLAAKSGLISIYIFLGCWSIYLTFSYKKIVGLVTISFIICTLFFAVKFIPTLSSRLDTVRTNLSVLKNGDKSGNYGDVGRLMSYDIAFKLIKEHPLKGVGTGDMLAQMKKGYDQYYPQVVEENRLLPHNQFLIVGIGCGIPVMIYFVFWCLYPLLSIRKNRESFYFFSVWLILFIQLLIEPVLEVQYGVFVFLFFLLLQWHTLPQKSSSCPKATN